MMTSPSPNPPARLVLPVQIARARLVGLAASLLAHGAAALVVLTLPQAPQGVPNPVILPVEMLSAPSPAEALPVEALPARAQPEPEQTPLITEPAPAEIAQAQPEPTLLVVPRIAEPSVEGPPLVPAVPVVAPVLKPAIAPPPPKRRVAPARAAAPPGPENRPVGPVETQPAASPMPPRVSDGWRHSLAAWLAARKTYPDAARRSGAEGSVALRFTVDRGGRVLDVVLVRGAGSAALDDAALAMLRGASLPAFGDDMPQDRITVTVQVHYSLTE